MFPFRKSGKTSSRQQIKIKEVRDDILILPNKKYCTYLETSSINFELKSEEEQDVIIDSFQNFLNSLPCTLQFVIRIRELDVEQYLERLTGVSEKEKETVYKEQVENYKTFIQTLISGNKILSRRFYIIISYLPTDTSDFSLIKEQLYVNRDIVIKGLEKMGMKARTLNSLEILNLFYTFYNPRQSKIQELNGNTIKQLINYGQYNI